MGAPAEQSGIDVLYSVPSGRRSITRARIDVPEMRPQHLGKHETSPAVGGRRNLRSQFRAKVLDGKVLNGHDDVTDGTLHPVPSHAYR